MDRSTIDYSRLILDIGDELTSGDVEKLKYTYKDKVSRGKREEASTGLKVLNALEDAGVFSENNLTQLREGLLLIKNQDLIGKLDAYVKKRADAIEHTKSAQQLNGPCNITDNMLVRHFKETQTFKELLDMLKTENVVVIHGPLGSGKSQLAIKYGLTFRQQNSGTASLSWKLHAKDQSSFRQSVSLLAEKLHLKVQKQPEDDDLTEFVKVCIESVNNESGTDVNLLIIDDVGEGCEGLVEYVINLLFRNQSWRIIITTLNELFLKDENHLSNQGFNENEAVEFLSDNRDCDVKAYCSLAKKMSYLPLGLNGARTYMTEKKISPSRFERYVTEDKLQNIYTKLDEKNIGKENRNLFGVLKIFIDILKKSLDADAFEMFLMTQFLETDNIPVILFAGLPETSDSDGDHSLSVDALVEAIQKFSLGAVDGIDDERLLSMHSAVSLTLQAFTPADDKINLLKKLLQTFASLMDKDNSHPSDYQRMISLLPHANLALRHADKHPDIKDDLETSILKIFLHNVVGFTFDLQLNKEMDKFHSDAAIRECYKLIGEEKFEVCLDKVRDGTFEEMDESSLKQIAQKQAETFITSLSDLVNNEPEKILNTAKHFIFNKRRSKDDLEFLSEKLKKDPKLEYKLTEKEYCKLCEQDLAIPLDKVKDSFVLELILGVFYTYGRRLYYVRNDSELSLRRRFCIALFVASIMAEHFHENDASRKPLCSMLTFINGTLQLYFDDLPQLGLRTNANLRATAEKYHRFLNTEESFFQFGVYKLSAIKDDYYRANCCKQLLRCYKTMIDIDHSETKGEEPKRQGCEVAEDLLEKLKDEKIAGRPRQYGIIIAVAEFFKNIEKLEDAEQLYRDVCPKDMIDTCQEIEIRMLRKHEFNAVYGLKDCYTKKGQTTKTIHLLQRLSEKLPKEQKKEHADIQRFMTELKKIMI